MSKFGGFFARKAGLYDKPAEPTPATRRRTTIRSNSTKNCSPRSAPSSAAITNPCAISCSTPTPRSASSTPSRMPSASWSIRSARRCAHSKPRNPKRSACRRCSTIRAPLTASCATKSPSWRRRRAFRKKNAQALRQELTTTQHLLRTLEATKAEIAIDIAARRAQIVDLEARLAQETGEGKALREENRRLDERLSTADKRVVGA